MEVECTKEFTDGVFRAEVRGVFLSKPGRSGGGELF